MRQEQPHLLVLLGPFIDIGNSDVQSGDIFYEEAKTGTIFLEYETLFHEIMNLIARELSGTQTQLVLVPSVLDAHCVSPFPQAPYDTSYFKSTEKDHGKSSFEGLEDDGRVTFLSNPDVL